MRYYTGLDAKLVPSYAGFYMEETYKPSLKKYLIFTVPAGNKPFIKSVKEALQTVNIESDFVYDVYKFYKTRDLVSHPAVISLPYSVMSFRFVELYSLGIPLFIPSLKFFANIGGLGHDRTSTSEPYCKKDPGLEKKMRPGFDLSTHLYSPNIDFSEDPEAELYWLQYSDFYDWPHIQHFDDYDHLKELVLQADLQSIHRDMLEELAFRKYKTTKSWCDISARILT